MRNKDIMWAAVEQHETRLISDDVRDWWCETVQKSEHFFNILSMFNVYTVNGDYLITLQAIQTRLETAAYPQQMAGARFYLLDSIKSVMEGVCAALVGNAEKAQSHIDEACLSLLALERELSRIKLMH
jgi:hypothetical protein